MPNIFPSTPSNWSISQFTGKWRCSIRSKLYQNKYKLSAKSARLTLLVLYCDVDVQISEHMHVQTYRHVNVTTKISKKKKAVPVVQEAPQKFKGLHEQVSKFTSTDCV